MRQHLRNGLLLCALTTLIYAQTFFFGFVTVDDPTWITDNPFVSTGLSFNNICHAFSFRTMAEYSNWVPLTFLSLMLDAQLYGLSGGGFHLTNVILHCAGTLMLYAALWRMTGEPNKSALVAALFAVHPLHVESVAWVTERKDVLSLFFGHAAIWAYAIYVTGTRRKYYVASMVLYLCSLMSKQTLVTLPFLLLLLDYWPLRRTVSINSAPIEGQVETTGISWWQLVVEKLPYLVLTVLFCGLALSAQQGAMRFAEQFSIPYRLMNAATSYLEYIGKTVWPANLSVFYPHRAISPAAGMVAGATLLGASLLAFRFRQRAPYAFVGWFWFLGTFVPVIGIVQIGMQRMADRYTYLPLTGLFLLVVWLVDDLARQNLGKNVLKIASVVVVLLYSVVAFRQTRYWADSVELCEKSLAATPDNGQLHHMLAVAWFQRGKPQIALQHFEQGAQLMPGNHILKRQWALCLKKVGQTDEAVRQLSRALEVQPEDAEAHFELGKIQEGQGQLDLARQSYQAAVAADPKFARAYYNLGVFCLYENRWEDAIEYFQQTVSLDPRHAQAHNNLAAAYMMKEDFDSARRHFEEALRIDPKLKQAKAGLRVLNEGGPKGQ